MIYTEKIRTSIKFAIKTHDLYQKQTRKGKNISYISHPLTVGIILARAGASEDVVVAGILHDTIEDSVPEKKVTWEMLNERFGPIVADLVQSVTENGKDESWGERKRHAREQIKDFSPESLLLKSADILSNGSELLDDYARYGDEVFERFSAPKDKFIKHQLDSIALVLECWPDNPLAPDLKNLANNHRLFDTVIN
jgi:hypothetical protein